VNRRLIDHHRPRMHRSRSAFALLGAVTAVALVAAPAMASAAAPAPAQSPAVTVSVRAITVNVVVNKKNTPVNCTIKADLYTPSTATPATRAAAILTTNGFGGSKADQAKTGMGFGKLGYVVLSYSGLGFGGSSCPITLDDRDHDGEAASQLVQLLGGSREMNAFTDDAAKTPVVIDTVIRQDTPGQANDPAVGMIGGSYGGEVQFAAAAVDPRVDTIIPLITWNDLAFSLAPNGASLPANSVSYPATNPGVSKYQWSTLFFSVGFVVGAQNPQIDVTQPLTKCGNFEVAACQAKAQLDAQGYPDAATVAYARSKSVASYLDKVKVPVLLAQGQADTLFTLQESVATYAALRANGTPVKLLWQSWGHSTSQPRPGELDLADPMSSHQGRVFAQWFDHYLRGAADAPALDFSYYRPWADTTGDASTAYASASSYPVAAPTTVHLSGSDALVRDPGQVQPGTAMFTGPGAGAPTSYTETSAVDQKQPVTDAPGTAARWSTTPLAQDVDLVGSPVLTVKLDAASTEATQGGGPGGQLELFAKLYDVAPDGTVDLPNRVIAPVRVADVTQPVRIELPALVHRVPAGHRIALTLSATDFAYRNSDLAQPVDVLAGVRQTLTLPTITPLAVSPSPSPSPSPSAGAAGGGGNSGVDSPDVRNTAGPSGQASTVPLAATSGTYAAVPLTATGAALVLLGSVLLGATPRRRRVPGVLKQG